MTPEERAAVLAEEPRLRRIIQQEFDSFMMGAIHREVEYVVHGTAEELAGLEADYLDGAGQARFDAWVRRDLAHHEPERVRLTGLFDTPGVRPVSVLPERPTRYPPMPYVHDEPRPSWWQRLLGLVE